MRFFFSNSPIISHQTQSKHQKSFKFLCDPGLCYLSERTSLPLPPHLASASLASLRVLHALGLLSLLFALMDDASISTPHALTFFRSFFKSLRSPLTMLSKTTTHLFPERFLTLLLFSSLVRMKSHIWMIYCVPFLPAPLECNPWWP